MKTPTMMRTARNAALTAVVLALAFTVNAQTRSDSARVTELLKNVKGHSALAVHDAELLESYTRSNVSWQSHSSQLNMIKTHVNNLIEDHNNMIASREDASAWQQEAIDQTDPLVKEIASRLNAMILHLADNTHNVKMKTYIDYAHSNYDLISRLDKMVSDYVDYEEAKSKADDLEKQLDIPTSGGDGE